MKLGTLPVGARICNKSESFCCHIAAQDHPGYGGTTLLSAQVELIGPFDAAEAENGDRAYGSNIFGESNLLQWLNGDAADWFSPQHLGDRPPTSRYIRHNADGYAERPGYLCQLPHAVKARLLDSHIPVHLLGKLGNVEVDYVTAKVFLPSRTEMHLGDDYGVPEGTPLPLLRDFRYRRAVLTEQAVRQYHGPWKPAFPMKPGCGWRYWLRSPHLRYPYLCRYVSEMGGLSFAPAFYEIIGCRPMMNVDGSLPVRAGNRPDNTYYIVEEGEEHVFE